MNKPVTLEADVARQPISVPASYGLALLLALAAYFLVFRIVRDNSLAADVRSTFCNVVPLALLVPLTHAALARLANVRRRPIRIALHPLLAFGFSLAWYWLVMLAIGISDGTLMDFRVEHYFPTSAAAWQLLQGMTVYVAIAAMTEMRSHSAQSVLFLTAPAETNEASSFSRYFIRHGEDIHPIDVDSILSIAGADDYAEVMTTGGRHLVKLTLSEFERVLDSNRFKRVHRSRIVNIHGIERAESAGGGRMLLHLQNGEIVQTSRAGARLLREHVL